MAGRIAYYGNISTDGLILNLDAARKDSYNRTGTNWNDTSGNDNNGTLTNGPTFDSEDYGSIVFDGTDDRVDMVKNGLSNGNQPFSVCSWVNTSKTTRELFFGLDDESHLDLNAYNVNGSTLSFHKYNTFVMYAPVGSITTGSIQHVVWTYNGTVMNEANAKMYVNGVMKTGYQFSYGNAGSSYNFDPNIPNFISNKYPAFSSAANYTGSVYTTQLYNKPLSPFDVWQNFNAYKSRYGIPDIVTDGLVLNLDAGNPYSYLSGSSGTTWTDVSGESNDGTLTNGASYSNGTIVFDGVDDYVKVNSNPQFLFGEGDSITVESWIKCIDINARAYQAFFTIGGVPDIDRDRLIQMRVSQYTNYGYVDMLHRNSTNTQWHIYRTSNIVVTENQWIHVAGTLTYGSGSTWKIYINGTLTTGEFRPGENGNQPPIQPSDVSIYLGPEDGSTGSEFFTGDISISKLYNRALSADEVQQNFNALRGRYGI